METGAEVYHCAVIGGGLAGLCLAIQLADSGYKVVLFEKNEYPFHKVCGEYVSMESRNFLISLGLDLDALDLPVIKRLGISSEQGFMLQAPLQMGGFGISRFSLDQLLCELALVKGVSVIQNCKVNSVQAAAVSTVQTSTGNYHANIVCGSYGKYTPAFLQQSTKNKPYREKGPNYIGVKYHIKTSLDAEKIELHNFKNGYCGISKVDGDRYCLCYLSRASNLRQHGGNIRLMEEKVLYKNPFLKTYFTQSDFIDTKPIVTSNIYFNKRHTCANGIFLLGDAAGSITPLCGNGMSMGMRASKLLAQELKLYFEGKILQDELARRYDAAWSKAFSRRIKTGYYLQHLFGKDLTTHYALKLLEKSPALTAKIISMTHGEIF